VQLDLDRDINAQLVKKIENQPKSEEKQKNI
jgi:hypothetical protein